MKHYLKPLTLALCCCWIIVLSCDQKIEIDLSEYEDRVVVQSILQPGQEAHVLLTRSQVLLGWNGQDVEAETITDAELSIRHAGVDYPMTLSNVSQDIFNGYGVVPTNNLLSTATAYPLRFYKADIDIQHGEEYLLTIKYKDQIITASTIVPQPVPIDHLEMGYHTETNNGMVDSVTIADIKFTDRLDEENAYIYDVFFIANRLVGFYTFDQNHQPNGYVIWDSIPTPVYWKVWDAFRTDAGLDGQQQSMRVWPPTYLSGLPSTVTDTIDLYDTLDVHVRLFNYHRDLRRYFQSLIDQPYVPQTPFVEPIRIWSNVQGAVGVFSSVAISDPKQFSYVVRYGSE